MERLFVDSYLPKERSIGPETKLGIVKLFLLEQLLQKINEEQNFGGREKDFGLVLQTEAGPKKIYFSNKHGWVLGTEDDFIPLSYQGVMEKLTEQNRTVNGLIAHYFGMKDEVIPLNQKSLGICLLTNTNSALSDSGITLGEIMKRNFSMVAEGWLLRAEKEAEGARAYKICLNNSLYYGRLGGIVLEEERIRSLPKTFAEAKAEKTLETAWKLMAEIDDNVGENLREQEFLEAMGELDKAIYYASLAKVDLGFAVQYAKELIPFTLKQADEVLNNWFKNMGKNNQKEELFWSWIGSAKKYADLSGNDISQQIDILDEKLRILKKKSQRPFFLRRI